MVLLLMLVTLTVVAHFAGVALRECPRQVALQTLPVRADRRRPRSH